MNDTHLAVTDIPRIVPGDEARRLATAMYDRLLAELAALSPDEWNASTVCEPWTVTDIVRHLVGAAKGHSSMREMARQARHGKKHADRREAGMKSRGHDRR